MAAPSRYSGKFVLRLPIDFHKKISHLAKAKGLSLNRFCVESLQKTVVPGSSSELAPTWSILLQELERAGVRARGLILFGSTARNEAGPSSDIDLLIPLELDIPLTRRLYQIWDECIDRLKSQESELFLNKPFSPQFVHIPSSVLAAGGIWYEVAIDGIVLSQKDFELTRFLSQIRLAIAEGIIKREMIHGHPYWIKHAK